MDERSFKYPNRQAQQAAYAPQAMNRPYSPPPVPGYARAYPPAMAATSPLDQAQVLTPGGFKHLSKAERDEAARPDRRGRRPFTQ